MQSKLLADSKELVHLEEVIVGDAIYPVIDVHTFLVEFEVDLLEDFLSGQL